MMSEKKFDKKLDELLKEVGNQIIDENNEALTEVTKVNFSLEHEEKMKKLFTDLRRNKKDKIMVQRRKLVTLAAMVTLIICSFSIAGACKNSILNFLFSDKQEYSEVGHNYTANSVQIGEIVFDYMPKGFKLENTNSGETKKSITFVCDSEYFTLEITKNRWSGKVNTEEGIIEDIIINDKEMVYTEKEKLRFLTWQENVHTYTLFTNCDKGILMEIAKNIKFLE